MSSLLVVVAVGFDGLALQEEELVDVNASLTLNESGEMTFTTLNPLFKPWRGQYVLMEADTNTVLWGGPLVKMRRDSGSTTWEMTCRTWEHWLDRVAPLNIGTNGIPNPTYNPALYDDETVKIGNIIRDLMALIPQTGHGVQVPLQPPAAGSGPAFLLAEPPEDQSRGSVWSLLGPARDFGIEMNVVWHQSGTSQFTPQLVVGNPNLGNTNALALWDDDISGGSEEYDGDQLSTRWRVRAGDEDCEMSKKIAGLPLLDGVHDYTDRFINANNEIAELRKRAEMLLNTSTIEALRLVNVTLPPGSILRPGDWLVRPDEMVMRVQQVQYSTSGTTLNGVEFDPLNLEAPLPTINSLQRELRSQRSRLLWNAMRQQIRA